MTMETVRLAFVILFAFAVLRLFYWQSVVLFRVLRPFAREDDRGWWPFRLPGKAKRRRMRAFLLEPEHRPLRRTWIGAWALTILSFFALLLASALTGS